MATSERSDDTHHRQTRPRLRKAPHAEFGEWTQGRDPRDNSRMITGEFRDGAHALGALNHFKHEHWIADQDYMPERNGPLYFICLREGGGDRLEGFLHWWTQVRGNPAPAAAGPDRTARNGAPPNRQTQAERKTLAYRPAPHDIVHTAIDQLTWEGTAQNHAAAIAPTPEAAFQIALYLRDKGHLDEKDFWRLNEDVKYADGDSLLRIVISPGKLAAFEAEFPTAGYIKAGIANDLLEQIAVLSGPLHKPAAPRPAILR